MDIGTLRGLGTLLIMVAFIGLVIWAYSGKRKKSFDEATMLPFADDPEDHPFLWGSKRTGPDLARVGGRYSDDWHRAHLYNPRNVVPESKMPAYPWLVENKLDGKDTATKMEVLRKLGVPYTDEDIAGAREAVKGKTEMDALVAFLQGLGTSIKSKR